MWSKESSYVNTSKHRYSSSPRVSNIIIIRHHASELWRCKEATNPNHQLKFIPRIGPIGRRVAWCFFTSPLAILVSTCSLFLFTEAQTYKSGLIWSSPSHIHCVIKRVHRRQEEKSLDRSSRDRQHLWGVYVANTPIKLARSHKHDRNQTSFLLVRDYFCLTC